MVMKTRRDTDQKKIEGTDWQQESIWCSVLSTEKLNWVIFESARIDKIISPTNSKLMKTDQKLVIRTSLNWSFLIFVFLFQSRPKKYGGLGVRAAWEANTALLGKLVWDIQHQRT